MILAVCGKGGVGKTAVTALLSRAALDAGIRPLLLVDADPVGGLVSAIGETTARSLGEVRSQVLQAARGSTDAERARLADDLDYLVMEALCEREDYALLAMGRKLEKGCFCPVNNLLREALDGLIEPFAAVLIDAEAGIEQVNRQVTRRVNRVVVVTDGSARSAATLDTIALMVGTERCVEVRNRVRGEEIAVHTSLVPLAGRVPEDDMVRRFDADGRPLWELPADNPALVAARRLVESLEIGAC